jgi:predicted DNA-binding protein (MmcQ/YjbR family)
MKASLAWKALKKHAAEKPGAWEDHPWGETVYKVAKKVFVFLGHPDSGYGMSCKLPDSGEAAITMFSWAEPTGYGLGKAGWVTAHFAPKDDVPFDLLTQWIDESYAAVAPKRAASKPAARARARR